MNVLTNLDYEIALKAANRRKIVYLEVASGHRVRLGSAASLTTEKDVAEMAPHYLAEPAVMRIVLDDDNERGTIYLKNKTGQSLGGGMRSKDRHYFVLTDWNADDCTFQAMRFVPDGGSHHIEVK